MLTEEELSAIEARVGAASGDGWRAGRASDGVAVVRVERRTGPPSELRVMRDLTPASEADVLFVAHSRGDVLRLVDAVRGRIRLSREDVQLIAARCDAASPGPWRVFLEEDGGIGGSNVIWVTERDGEPDLYLWLDSKIAPGEDFEFVAHAREDIPELLSQLRDRS